MAQIRDSSIIRTPEVSIDPRFSFPEDVVDLKQDLAEEEDYESYDDNDSSDIVEVTLDQTVPSSDDLSEPGTPATLNAPQTLTVISQTIRVSAEGSAFVDVVVEVEDVNGADTYEIRVTR